MRDQNWAISIALVAVACGIMAALIPRPQPRPADVFAFTGFVLTGSTCVSGVLPGGNKIIFEVPQGTKAPTKFVTAHVPENEAGQIVGKIWKKGDTLLIPAPCPQSKG